MNTTNQYRVVRRDWGRHFTISVAHFAIDEHYQGARQKFLDEEIEAIRSKRQTVRPISVEQSQPLPLTMLQGVGSSVIVAPEQGIGLELTVIWGHDCHEPFAPGESETEDLTVRKVAP